MSYDNNFLRKALAADAIACGAMGALLILASSTLSGPLGLPTLFLTVVGTILLPLAIWIGLLARNPHPPRKLVWLLIAGNAVWMIDSFLLLALGWLQPTSLGVAFIVAQAIVTGVFAELEYVALKRMTATVAA